MRVTPKDLGKIVEGRVLGLLCCCHTLQ